MEGFFIFGKTFGFLDKAKRFWKSKKDDVLRGLIILVIILLSLIILLFLLSLGPFDKKPEKIIWGVTFSKQYSQSLGLDWKENYLAILNDLNVKNLRIPAYWNEIEPKQDWFYFNNLDWQIQEAESRGASIILSIGRRLPRWPECHIPPWAKEQDEKTQQERILVMLEKVVERYKGHSSIKYWQVENEPFFPHFGICPEPDERFFKKEIELVKSLDSRPIIVSDTGELSTWWKSTRYADIFGTTMYRLVPNLDKTCCYEYPFPPWWYRKHANVLSHFRKFDKIIVVELQTEAWAINKFITELPIEEAYQSMSPDIFRQNIEYARDSGIGEIYLWGAEWWYWLKTIKNEPFIWDEARIVFGS